MVLIIAAVLLTAAGTCLVPAAVSLRMRRLRPRQCRLQEGIDAPGFIDKRFVVPL